MEWHGSDAFRSMKDDDLKPVSELRTIANIDEVTVALGPSDNGNTSQSDKPRKKAATSAFLKYFEVAPDGKSRTCKFCGQSYSIATATGNLGRHLANRHPGYDKSGVPVTTTSTAPRIVSVVRKHQPEAKTSKLDFENFNWLLIKWLSSSSVSPAMLEDTWLLNSFKFLSPSIHIWSREKFQVVLSDVYKTMQEDVRRTLDQVASKVAVALEFWTSYEKINYMGITCHWIDDNWTFQKVLLDICRIPYPTGGVEVYHALVKVLKIYNIDDKVLACTHDNSQSAIDACQTLKEDMDSHKFGPFCYIPCAGQALNTIIEDGLRSTKPIISKVREFVMEMNASSAIIEDFLQLTAAYQEGTWKFPMDSSSRWDGHYQMLDIVCKADKSVDAVILKHEASLGRMLLTAGEKNAVNVMHAYLEPFYKTTNDICANRVPTVGLVLFLMDHISETIDACIDSHHQPDWLRSAAEEMAVRARGFNEQVCNVFTYMTAVLDPRIKVELIPEYLNSESNLDEARTYFLRNYYTSHFSSVTNIYGAQDNNDDGACLSFAEEIARKKRRTSTPISADELPQYLSEPPAPLTTDVLEWWKANSNRYPRLAVMARDFLSVQATSVIPEELFSSKGDEIEKQRFGLPAATSQALLCIKSWTESGFKLKYNSTEINCDRLMELAAETAGQHSKTSSGKKC